MRIFRAGVLSDLPAIYDFQNVPLRQSLMERLPPYEDFLKNTGDQMRNHETYYYLLEQDNSLVGFIEFTKLEDGWDTNVWGKWLKTLTYGAGVSAFDILGFSKLKFGIRETNVRMINACELFRFRFIKKEYRMYYRPGFFSIGSTYIIHYEVTTEEYLERKEFLTQQSLPVLFR